MTDPAPQPAALPIWPSGTVVTLVTAGAPPHAIPVSAAVRASDDRLLLGLARGRDSLARLRADPLVAVAITAADVAITAYGSARVLVEEIVGGVAAVEVTVTDVADHDRPTFVIESGVGWSWTDEPARHRDAELRAALERLAAG